MLRARNIAILVVVAVAAFYLGALTQFQLGAFAPSWVESLLLYTPPKGHLDLNLLSEEFRAIQQHYVNPNPDALKLSEGAAAGVVTGLGDQFSRFETAQDYQQSQSFLQGTFAGIGASVLQQSNQIVIAGILPNTPAERAGLKAGDIIITVDGQSTKGWTADQAVQKVRGNAGTHVVLGLQRNGKTFTVDLVREVIQVPSVDIHVFGNVLYVRIFDFGDRTADEFDTVLKTNLKGSVDRIVLDLRGNPGGYVDAAVSVISEFVQKGDAVVLVDRSGKPQPKPVSGTGRAFSNKLVVLVDADTASASEITSGALKDHNRATLVGVKTFGKGSVQEDFLLRGGDDLHLTIAHWLTPKRHPIDNVGITPDHVVTLDQSSDMYAVDQTNSDPSKDTQLQEALALAAG